MTRTIINYVLPPTRSLKRLGLRGDVAAEIDDHELVLRLAGTKSGAEEFPLDSIRSVLVGIVFNKVSDYRMTISCDGHRPIGISGRYPNQYGAFALALAEAMERLGRLDRVRCGVPLLLSWGPFFALLGIALAAGGLYELTGALARQADLLVPVGMTAAGLVMAGAAIRHFLRWERPRPLDRVGDMTAYLP